MQVIAPVVNQSIKMYLAPTVCPAFQPHGVDESRKLEVTAAEFSL